MKVENMNEKRDKDWSGFISTYNIFVDQPMVGRREKGPFCLSRLSEVHLPPMTRVEAEQLIRETHGEDVEFEITFLRTRSAWCP